MLFHINSHQSAGWLICKYFWSGACSVERALQKFNTASGGTGTLAHHTKTHQSGKAVEEQNVLVRKLGPHGKETITEAAALAVCHDILPFSFAEKREGMTSFAGAIFRAGQATAVSETIDIHDMLPSAKTVREGVRKLSREARSEFSSEILPGALIMGGGMTCDGLSLKIQDKHFYDLTVHFMELGPRCALTGAQSFKIICRTLLLAEATEGETAVAIKRLIEMELQKLYGLSFEHLKERFTFVTDYCATMPKGSGGFCKFKSRGSQP